jgi:hypothetical protein
VHFGYLYREAGGNIMLTQEEKMKLLIDSKYSLVAKYDPEWIYENAMGCHSWAAHIRRLYGLWATSASII